ncbi:unnamed protein product [Enterobius vermicularis]|uniref:Ovule protein n=1 Tax=Enterobius vermicularis TaxID=51028 RepID=A0A0N4V2T3_ENTVE|nr:unnamed protein product [Enterobius vermicularis]
MVQNYLVQLSDSKPELASPSLRSALPPPSSLPLSPSNLLIFPSLSPYSTFSPKRNQPISALGPSECKSAGEDAPCEILKK